MGRGLDARRDDDDVGREAAQGEEQGLGFPLPGPPPQRTLWDCSRALEGGEAGDPCSCLMR